MRTIVAFDISNDRVRARVVKALLGRGQRVQKSVFELPDLRRAAYLRLRSELEGLVDPNTDSLRYYRVCASCADRIECYGVGPGLVRGQLAFEVID